MMDALSRTGRVQLIAIAKRMLELEEGPPAEHTPRTRAEGLSDHMIALVRYARGMDPMPEPSRESAQAITDHYHLLLDENQRLRAELGAQRVRAELLALTDRCAELERWRVAVLESTRRSALERAAAWQLTSLLEELHGHGLDAEFARLYAEEAKEHIEAAAPFVNKRREYQTPLSVQQILDRAKSVTDTGRQVG